jgi:hypothetical protein
MDRAGRSLLSVDHGEDLEEPDERLRLVSHLLVCDNVEEKDVVESRREYPGVAADVSECLLAAHCDVAGMRRGHEDGVAVGPSAREELGTDTSVEAGRSLDLEAILPQGCGKASNGVACHVAPSRQGRRRRRRGRSDGGESEQDSGDAEASHAMSR